MSLRANRDRLPGHLSFDHYVLDCDEFRPLPPEPERRLLKDA